jgi:hypothetical protein
MDGGLVEFHQAGIDKMSGAANQSHGPVRFLAGASPPTADEAG